VGIIPRITLLEKVLAQNVHAHGIIQMINTLQNVKKSKKRRKMITHYRKFDRGKVRGRAGAETVVLRYIAKDIRPLGDIIEKDVTMPGCSYGEVDDFSKVKRVKVVVTIEELDEGKANEDI